MRAIEYFRFLFRDLFFDEPDYISDQGPLKDALDLTGNTIETAINLFSPYKKVSEIRKQALLPFRGMFDIVYGLVSLTLSPVLLVTSLTLTLGRVVFFNIPRMLLAMVGVADKDDAFEAPLETARFIMGFAMSVVAAVDGLVSILNGVVKLALTPIAWTKAIVFGIPKVFQGDKVEEDDSFQKAVAKLKNIKPDQSNHLKLYDKEALRDVHERFEKLTKKGRKSDIHFFNDGEKHTRYEICEKEREAYLGIFKSAQSRNPGKVDPEQLKKYIDTMTQTKK